MGSLNLLINKQANSGNYQNVKELPKNKNLLTEYKTQQYLEVAKVPKIKFLDRVINKSHKTSGLTTPAPRQSYANSNS